jgi:dTDP-4-dehydrorhamnose 3,5-epimerase
LIFTETELKGAYIIELEKFNDERGFFARSWNKEEFEKHDLNSNLVQCNVSFNKKKGTLRGMHYQASPYEEIKLVRCTRGKIFDVIIDLRKNSNTYKKWFGVELSQDNYKMFYIPKGFAHGFETLEENTEIFYQMSTEYNEEMARGIRWNDPTFSIFWPLKITAMSERDKNFSFYGD